MSREPLKIEMGIGWKPDPHKPGNLRSCLDADYVAEIESLRAEIERLTKEAWETFEANGELAKLTMELRAEIDRLRAALQAIEHETGMTMLATNHGRRGDKANAIARAALEPKP